MNRDLPVQSRAAGNGRVGSARTHVVRRLADLIRLQLFDGEPSTPVPDEAELMQRFAAPRDVVRESLALLVEEGVIERRRGLGTYPRRTNYHLNAEIPPPRMNWDEFLGVGRLHPRVAYWGWAPLTAEIARRIDPGAGDADCLCVDYTLLRDEQPLGLITNYLRRREGESLVLERFTTDYYALLDDAGVGISACDFEAQPQFADAHIAHELGITEGATVLRLEQTIWNDRHERINFAIAHFVSELRFRFEGISRSGPAHGGEAP